MKVDIAHLAMLAKLSFTPEEMQKYEGEMQAIVEMVSTLPNMEQAVSALNPDNPMALRPDAVLPSLGREQVLANAPVAQAGCIAVPRTVE